jgi:hypothetical protein
MAQRGLGHPATVSGWAIVMRGGHGEKFKQQEALAVKDTVVRVFVLPGNKQFQSPENQSGN